MPSAQDGKASVRGDDWSFGYNLGLLVTPRPGTRVGFAYRSKIDHELRGEATFEFDQAGNGDRLAAATGRFVNTGASADASLPETLSLGVYHELNATWAVMSELAWTSWSNFDELRISFDNQSEPDNVTEQGYRDSFFAALGVTWRANDVWSLRGGVAYDQGATNDRLRTPRLPGGDRYWLSTGVDFRPSRWFELSAGLTRIFVEEGTIDLSTDGVDNQFRGNLSGEIDSDVFVGSISVTLHY